MRPITYTLRWSIQLVALQLKWVCLVLSPICLFDLGSVRLYTYRPPYMRPDYYHHYIRLPLLLLLLPLLPTPTTIYCYYYYPILLLAAYSRNRPTQETTRFILRVSTHCNLESIHKIICRSSLPFHSNTPVQRVGIQIFRLAIFDVIRSCRMLWCPPFVFSDTISRTRSSRYIGVS